MKRGILAVLCTSLLLLAACRKEEEKSLPQGSSKSETSKFQASEGEAKPLGNAAAEMATKRIDSPIQGPDAPIQMYTVPRENRFKPKVESVVLFTGYDERNPREEKLQFSDGELKRTDEQPVIIKYRGTWKEGVPIYLKALRKEVENIPYFEIVASDADSPSSDLFLMYRFQVSGANGAPWKVLPVRPDGLKDRAVFKLAINPQTVGEELLKASERRFDLEFKIRDTRGAEPLFSEENLASFAVEIPKPKIFLVSDRAYDLSDVPSPREEEALQDKLLPFKPKTLFGFGQSQESGWVTLRTAQLLNESPVPVVLQCNPTLHVSLAYSVEVQERLTERKFSPRRSVSQTQVASNVEFHAHLEEEVLEGSRWLLKERKRLRERIVLPAAGKRNEVLSRTMLRLSVVLPRSDFAGISRFQPVSERRDMAYLVSILKTTSNFACGAAEEGEDASFYRDERNWEKIVTAPKKQTFRGDQNLLQR